MGYTKQGSDYAEEQSVIQWSPQAYVTIQRFHGLRSSMLTLAASAQSSGLKYTLSPGEGPNATLEIEYSGSTTPTESPVSTEWSVTTKASQVPIEEHPRYSSDIATFDLDEMVCLRQLLDNVPHSQIDVTDLSVVTATGNIEEMVKKYLGGTTSYLRPETILSVRYQYQATASALPPMGDVGKVYTKANLITALSIPSDIQTELPAGDYLCEDVDWGASTDGSRILTQSYRHAEDWDGDLYTHVTP